MKRASILLALFAASACAEPLEFADWTIEAPEGTRVIEYAAVPIEEGTERIELIEDLVIGERAGDENYLMYNTRGPAVGLDGSIYVLDSGNVRVQVFDANGAFVRTLGKSGQGPGEFTRPSSILIAGDRVLVQDGGNRRFGVWSVNGDHLGEIAYPPAPTPSGLRVFDDGTMVGRVTIRAEDEDALASFTQPHYQLRRYGSEIELLEEILDFPRVKNPAVTRRTETNMSLSALAVPSPRPSYTATRGGRIYASTTQEYQVHALDRNSNLLWALRVAWHRAPITEEEKVAAIEQVRKRIPDATRSEVDWPEARPALSYIAVDGHGHIYAYPYPENREAAESQVVAVDVYDSGGERLFAGMIPAIRWVEVQGDFVYGRDTNDDTGEERVIRYRLVEPFE